MFLSYEFFGTAHDPGIAGQAGGKNPSSPATPTPWQGLEGLRDLDKKLILKGKSNGFKKQQGGNMHYGTDSGSLPAKTFLLSER